MKQKQNRKESEFKTFVKRHLVLLTLILAFVVLFMLTVTFSWYRNQVSLEGNTFKTGTIDFISRGYDASGNLMTTILQDSKDSTGYEKVNMPLFQHTGWTANMEPETSYLIIEKTGTLEMDYKISFSASGTIEYLGGFWYSLTDVTNEVMNSSSSSDSDYESLLKAYISRGNLPKSETDGYNMATMDRYATIGSILDEDNHNARYYRLDYGMKSSAIPEEYTGLSIEVFAKIFVTQVGALDSEDGTGYTYNCTSQLDVEKAREQALPGDNIVLINNITYEGDLVFNKAVNIFTNNYTLEVLGNLIYEYVAPTDLTVNVSGNGRILVSCPREGVGGNFTIEAPNSNVVIVGSNTSDGDIVTESRFTVSGTHAYGAAGVTLRNLRVIDKTYGTLKTIYINSNSRISVTDNTTISRLEAVARATNIEIQNMGTVREISLTNMYILSQTFSPQIYIYNMGIINQPIQLPSWSIPFKVVSQSPFECTGNTKIVQAITGNDMSVTGATVNGAFTTADIERESMDETVVPMENSDTKLIIYYQNVKKEGNLVETTIQSLLEDYFKSKDVANIATALAEITDIKVISVDSKRMLNSDIQYLRSGAFPYLKNLDLERVILYDTDTSRENRLFDNAFHNDKRIENLVLPQRLESIGTGALYGMSCDNIIRIPESVTEFGVNWFRDTKYVCFDSPTPPMAAYDAPTGLYGVKAIFVEEPYISVYKQNFAGHANIIYCVGQKDDSGKYFVRPNSQGNDWELVYYVGSQDSITSLSIGSDIRVSGQLLTIANIGENAFRNTLPESVVSIRFADSVRVIGKNAFYGRSITTVESWGGSLTTIGYGAFENCSLFKGTINLPDTMETIDSYAFSYCSMIDGINTGGTVLVRTGAFQCCSSMVFADMPKVETFENTGIVGIFRDCPRLVSVKALSLKKTIGPVFWDLPALREIVFGKTSFEEIDISGFYAFYGSVKSGTKVYFDADDVSSISVNGVSSDRIYAMGEKMGELLVNGYNIGQYIVRHNDDGYVVLVSSNIDYVSSSDSTEVINLPDKYDGDAITAIGANAFRHQNFDNVKISFDSKLEKIGANAFISKSGIKGVDFSQASNLEIIDTSAFYSCSGITGSLEFSSALKTINHYAFYGCTGISSVNTGGAEYLGEQVFANCSELIAVEMPKVLIMGTYDTVGAAFENCLKLVHVTMPELYSLRGYYTFRECKSLREIYMASSNTDVRFDILTFEGCDTSKIKLFVPEDLVSVYRQKELCGLQTNRVFETGEKMDELLVNGYNIGKYIVKENADGTATIITTRLDFAGDVTIPDVWHDNGTDRKITAIGESAFKGDAFDNVTLSFGDNLVTIGDNAFRGISGLKNVAYWGNSLEKISYAAFYECVGLSVDIVLPDSVKYIGNSAFSNSDIKGVNTGGAVSLGTSVFESCPNLVWAELPNVVTVGTEGSNNNTFAYSSNLVSAKLPKLSYANGMFLFLSCGSLREVYLGASDFDTISEGAFYNISKENIKVFVPESLLDFYVSKNPGQIGATRIYPEGVKVGNNLLNGFNLGTYIVKMNSDGQSASIVTSHSSFTGDVILPDTFDNNGTNVPITTIFKNAFVNQKFTDVNLTVGEYVKEIGQCAFEGRTGIISADIRKTEIVYGAAFRGCSGLNNLVANYLKTVSGGNAFDGCTSLIILTLPKLEMTIGSQNFANNTSLKKVYLQNIISLGGGDFYYCSGLEEFVINKKIETVAGVPTAISAIFTSDVPADLPIKVPASTLSFYNGSWQGRPVLSYGNSITAGDDLYVVILKDNGYVIQSYIGSATNVVLPETLESVKVIGLEKNAFEIVTQTITSVGLPEHLYILGSNALSELSYLEEITVHENNRFFSSSDGVLYSKDGMMLVKYPCNKADISFNVTDTVVAIGANAFKNATKLQTIIFGSNLGVIDSTSFEGCTELKQVTFNGTEPPILMGPAIFDTSITDFAITVPTGSVETYIRALNFAEYASFINGGTEVPQEGMMNIVNWQPAIIQETGTYALSSKEKDEDDDEDEDVEGDGETDI